MSRLTVALRAKKFQVPWGKNYQPPAEAEPFRIPLGIQIDNAAGKTGAMYPPLLSPKHPTGIPFIPPQAPGTKINNWLFHYIDYTIGRVYERVFTHFWNSVIRNTNIGLYSKHYNPKVHGIYCHWRWYGPRDTKFMDVQLKDLKAWFSRREYTPGAIVSEVMRNFWRIHNLYGGAIFGPVLTTLWRALLFYSMFCFPFQYFHYREANKKCYYNW